MIRLTHGHGRIFHLTCSALALAALAACTDGFGGKSSDGEKTDGAASVTTANGKGGQRDIEAPEVFEVSEAALWDGRPSLGGLWVAHPDVTDPQRVIIRNTVNGKSVSGALFRRERDIPGPRIQASSEAAEALDMLPGAPVQLQITALIREPVEQEPESAEPKSEGTTEESSKAVEATGAAAVANADAEATDGAGETPPEEKKFRWPWSKPKEDAAAATDALETPPEVSETALEPAEEAALLPANPIQPASAATATRPSYAAKTFT